jgi:hypothetical protein
VNSSAVSSAGNRTLIASTPSWKRPGHGIAAILTDTFQTSFLPCSLPAPASPCTIPL